MSLSITKYSVLFFLLIILHSCVDRIDLDTGLREYPIVVEGFISDQPGSYEIRVSRSFDVQSKSAFKTEISAKKITLSDDAGNSEVLQGISTGLYRTSESGMQGVIGRSYKIKVELLDGRIYESIPDEILSSGTVDSVYFSFIDEKRQDFTTEYGFDVFFNSSIGGSDNTDFMWRFVGTYQIDTNPEAHKEDCGEGKCPRPRPCSGWVVVGFDLQQVGPCDCCTCWVDFSNEVPILSDNEYIGEGKYYDVKAYRVPLTQWIFMHKVYVRIEQMSLTPRALTFWKAIKSQKEASASLFQPISGVVPNNYVQISGDPGKLEGFFFATAIKSRGVFITRYDVPNPSIIPVRDLPYNDSCLTFPNSTNQIPDFWQ